ncbi:MAG TPA: FtsQ-type POTRA domain-containing protein [Acidimicrobiales bacterium]
MHPRLASRRADVGREAGRRRLMMLLGALSLLSVVVIAYVALHSSLFAARHVTIVGNQATTDQQILDASGMLAHPALLNIDVAREQSSIERLPFIDTAVIHREWPDSVLITVTERNPVATFSVSAHLFGVVDETGRLLEISSAPPTGLVPLVIPGLTSLTPGHSLPRADALLALVASAVPESILRAIATVEGTSTGVVVQLRSGAKAELGQATDLVAKMTALATMLATPSVVLGAHSSIDLRVPDAPVVTSS